MAAVNRTKVIHFATFNTMYQVLRLDIFVVYPDSDHGIVKHSPMVRKRPSFIKNNTDVLSRTAN